MKRTKLKLLRSQLQFPLVIIDKKKIRSFLEYVREKYGTNFIAVYENYNSKIPSNSFSNSKKIVTCVSCQKQFETYSSEMCPECKCLEIRKNWPTKAQLEIDIQNLNWEEIGKKYGVSRSSSKNWAKKYGILFSNERAKKELFFCTCGKDVKRKGSLCKECYLKSLRSKNLLLKTKILKMKETMSWKEIANELGVTESKARAFSRRES
jgi:hypothetical protein